MGWGGIHLVIRGAKQVITRGVEAEPGHGALVGTDHLHTGGVGNGPDPDCGVGRSREHQLLHRDNTRRFTWEKFTSPSAPSRGFHQRRALLSRFEGSWKQGKSQTHLGWVEDDAGDFLGVAFERGQDLLRALVKHDDVFVGSTWKTAGMGVWGQPTPNPPALCFLSPFKFPKAWRMRPTPRWEVPRKAPLPVRILLVSEGHRSKARIPGILALCSPCVREENAKLMPQAVKQS